MEDVLAVLNVILYERRFLRDRLGWRLYMMKKSRYIVLVSIILFVSCLCIPMAREAVIGEAAQETISITEFYNDGVFGSGYEKARDGAVVTISNVEEMRIFLSCLYDYDWTYRISFRQEADISFSNYIFEYEFGLDRIVINRDGTLLKHYCRYLNMDDIQALGLAGACVKVKSDRDFCGQYDGQGYSISGFILTGNDSRYSGIFGHVAKQASICRVKLRNCFLNYTCGALCGYNEGVIEDCSVEYILGIGFWVGGLIDSNAGTVLRCKLDHGLLYATDGRLGGIAANSYGGSISDCAAEHLQVQMIEENSSNTESDGINNSLSIGGIAGYQTGGQIRNCSSFYEAVCSNNGYRNVGGIVGYLEDDIQSGILEISNCIFAGKLSGRTVGGIVGKIGVEKSASEILLKNNLSLACVEGGIIGGIVGQLDEGQVSTCYFHDISKALTVVGQKNGGNVTDCHAVNEEQVYGNPSADVIAADSTYSNTKMLLAALNNGVAGDSDYLKWKAGALGYPVLLSGLKEAPVGDYEPGSEIKSSMPYQPEASASPSPDATPEASVSPSPDVSPSLAVTAPPSGEENEDKQNLIKKLTIKKLKAEPENSLDVRLSWNKNQWADGYHILRSLKSSSGFRMIGKTSASKPVYVDKTANRGKTYYYMVRGYAKITDSTVYGNGQKKKIQTAWYQAPALRLNVGKASDGKAYVQVGVSKYSGSYVEVYFKVSGKKYVKAPLKNKKLAFYNGKLRFSYKTKSLLYCKVRTYQIKKGKKYYSAFSKERKIRL